ncbi:MULTISPECIES: TadE/TadG family type IV pilus assembly protein [unclassified Sphingomonas]|uniref:TadE/TadG family type IV pilus assembly protein n=1 Tax=unclassified Sphingomonas TaxID=196159 RepID=UPI000BCFD7AC|nr:MAG: hypothetical protein B7Z43_07030 [Sphingomonas sp. 12-62-6]OYX38100.1 MAG: hypothetical protein B7Y98_09700 [Sphingomonas sp. 32-62-10]
MILAKRLPRSLRCVARDTRGATVVEFGFVAPILVLTLLGAFDVAHTLYVRSVLQGVVQKVGRDSALEGNDEASAQTAIDNKVRAQVRALANNSTITITRRFYKTFSKAAAAQAETWTDTNANTRCDAGEPYEDANLNGTWDADGGNAGQGGAKDAVMYTVDVSYRRMFPLYNLVSVPSTTTVKASTILKNQPYDEQASYGTPVTRNCP